MSRKLKIGFLVDDLDFRGHAVEVLDFVLSHQESFSIPFILYGHHEKVNKKTKLKDLILKFRVLYFIRFFLFHSLLSFIKVIERRQISNDFQSVRNSSTMYSKESLNFIELNRNISRTRNYLEFSQGDIDIIGALKLDVIVRLGTGILKGPILSSAKFGVISLHLGDNRVNRGGPAGFWEVLKNEPSTGFIVQKLNSELDGGEVLLRGNIMTASTWTRNYQNLIAKSPYFLCKVLFDLSSNKQLPEQEAISLHFEPLLRFDYRSGVLIKYMINVWGGILRDNLKKNFFEKNGDWRIAFSPYDGFKKSLWRFTEIPNNKLSFFADPFVMTHNGCSTIFVEEFDKLKKKGSISAIDITDGKPKLLGRVLEENFHLSFPFVFKHNNKIFMVPETSRANQIRLYECILFPTKWKLSRVLIDNINAADTMVVRKNGKWFLFTNICSAGTGDYNSELHIFYANSIFSNRWLPIGSGNPVVFDSLKARSAGLLITNGEIYRINQIHGKNHYGQSVGINRIDRLDSRKYTETRIQNVMPNFKKGLKSIHHLHSDEYFTVIDFN